MKILHITNYFHPATAWGGPVVSLKEICENLAKHENVNLDVLTTDAAGPNASEPLEVSEFPVIKEPGYKVYFCPKSFGRFFSVKLLQRSLAKIKEANVVHLTSSYTFNTLWVLFWCKIFSKPLVWSPRGAILATESFKDARSRRAKRIFETFAKFLLSKRSVLHSTSNDETAILSLRFPNTPNFMSSNGVAFSEISKHADSPDSTNFKMLFLSRLDKKKGIENLLNAMTDLPPNHVLDVCGEGLPKYTETLVQMVRTLGLTNRVVFSGHVEGHEKELKFQEADIFVLPSYSENFGNVVAESLMRGLPVITTKGTPWQDVETKNCGLWIENDPKSLVNAINKIADMDLHKMGRNGHQWMRDDFSWVAKTDIIFNQYKNLVAR